jgi:hypothetical protein
MIGEPWFPGLTLKTLLKWDLYWNKCTLYIKIEGLLKHDYTYIQYIIYCNYPKRLVCSYVRQLRSLVIGCAQDRSTIAEVRNVVHTSVSNAPTIV